MWARRAHRPEPKFWTHLAQFANIRSMGRRKGEGTKPQPTDCLDCGAKLSRYQSGYRRSYCNDCMAARTKTSRRRQAARDGTIRGATDKEIRDLLEVDARIENNKFDRERKAAEVTARKARREKDRERKAAEVAVRKERRREEARAKEIAEELHPEQFIKRRREIDRKRRAQSKGRQYINKLKGAPCTDCGETFHPDAMEFDHVRGEKWRNISRLTSASVDTIRKEIAKCDLVCANCHRVRTATRRQSD